LKALINEYENTPKQELYFQLTNLWVNAYI